jgi:phosphoglycerol transferase MdoB-like AlkP superfamily enzyme
MKPIKTLIAIFVLWTLVGVVSKIPFLLMYNGIFNTNWMLVIWHGLRLDIAIAGYLCMIPGLILIIQEIKAYSWYRWLWKGYFSITSLLYSLAIIANLGLYGYWGFPLDNTPLLYLKTSPKDAFASVPIWQTIFLFITIFIVAWIIYKILIRVTRQSEQFHHTTVQRLLNAVGLLILTTAMIIPIRGGFSTGTNHTGSVYFSPDIKLNHAAVNPAFCFFESVSHQKQDLSTMYRFMEDKDAENIFLGMIKTSNSEELRVKSEESKTENLKRNVLLIILESFSDSIMHIPGATPQINKLSTEGLYFHNFYASSTRTDRALASILSGVPAQPTMTILDVPRISNSLPSLANSLKQRAYATHFYYGGDTNYSNMQSYLMATGFQKVTSEKDFPAKELICKWGAPDEYVYNRLLNDIEKDETDGKGRKWFKVILTESSHEPFDVPYKSDNTNIASSDVLNAFAYSDKCLGDFINKMRELPCWNNTMVVIVADHLGAYPENIDNYKQWRYHIPFIILNADMDIDVNVVGGQIDIPATILSILGYDHREFLFSKDLRDADAPHFAFFSFPDAMGMVKDGGFMVYDNNSNQLQGTPELENQAKAYLQKLYDYLSKR